MFGVTRLLAEVSDVKPKSAARGKPLTVRLLVGN